MSRLQYSSVGQLGDVENCCSRVATPSCNSVVKSWLKSSIGQQRRQQTICSAVAMSRKSHVNQLSAF